MLNSKDIKFKMNCIICGKELTEKQISKGQKVCSRSCSMKKFWSNKENRLKLSNKCKQSWSNDELKQKQSNLMKEKYTSETLRQKVSRQTSKGLKEKWRNKNYKENMKVVRSDTMKKLWTDDNYRNCQIQSFKNYWTIEARKSQSDKFKNFWKDKNYRIKQLKRLKKLWKDENYRNKLSKSHKIYVSSERFKKNLKDWLNKVNATKRKNNTFNTSKPEQHTKELLEQKFDKVLTQYKDERYPFNCDFYVPSLDLFIECNYHWTHGREPYDENNIEHQNRLNYLQSKDTDYYKNAIYTWTKLDLKKLEYFKKNKLNYKIFYNFEEFLDWINSL